MKNLLFLSLLLIISVSFIASKPSGKGKDAIEDAIYNLIDGSRPENYTLVFFNQKSLAEFIRWIFVVAQQPYKDVRIDLADWPAQKTDTARFPFNQVPVLEINRDDKRYVLGQSMAIAKYLAKRFDLAGKMPLETAFVDMYGEQLKDVFDAYLNAGNNTDALNTLLNTTVPKNMQYFETKLGDTGTGYLVGNSLTWADIYLSQITDFLGNNKAAALANFPLIKGLDDRVRSLPSIAKWLLTRPDTSS